MQFVVFFLAIVELAGIASILPFMAVVSDETIIEKNEYLLKLYDFLEMSNRIDFLVFLGGIVFVTILISNLIGLFSNYLLTKFGFELGKHISTQLFSHLLNQSYLFHVHHNSSILTNKIMKQVDRSVMGVIIPFLQVNSRFFIVIFITIGLMSINPVLSLLTGLILSVSYIIIFYFTKKILSRNSIRITKAANDSFKIINEGFGGIKEIKFLGKEDSYAKRYDGFAQEYASSATVNQVIPVVPRYLLEIIAFGAVVISILYFLKMGEEIGHFLPMLSLFAVGGLKLMPALQQVFAGVANIKGSLDALDDIMEDIKGIDSKEIAEVSQTQTEKKIDLPLLNSINLKEITFSYPSSKKQVLKKINISIPVNKSIAFVGPSGSGKTTLVDIFLGLLDPDSGFIEIDNQKMTSKNKRSWQKKIGYVPQFVYLSDSTIEENIAFGVAAKDINKKQVERAAKMAHLDDFIKSLPRGYQTGVGERGVQLSGGQKQRIGIARALYNQASVLVFDEATSSLDGVTEKSVMKEINELAGHKTIIIIAHRLSTIKKCDKIFLLKEGAIYSSGTYDELKEESSFFEES